MGVSCCLLSLLTNTKGVAMVRSILAAVLLITLVSITSATGAGYQKKIFLKYAMNNLLVKCVGQQANDKFILEYIKAAKKCHNREFDAQLKPVYIKPYPVEGQNYYNTRFTSNPVGYHTHPQQQQQQYYNQQQLPYPQQQYQQYQQQPQYQQQQNYVQQPQYQQQRSNSHSMASSSHSSSMDQDLASNLFQIKSTPIKSLTDRQDKLTRTTRNRTLVT